ncbi:MAG: YbfB/YjiJ family MFS transporter [Actinomycetota bacterium]|nr:YbfB/YjiJ family MFS transporter [Actinomycetota bacterium]
MSAAPATASARRTDAARWGMVAAGTALIGTCYGFARFAYGLFAPELRADFAMSSSVSGVVGAGSYAGYCVAIVVSLVLTERFGARRLAVAAGVVATVGTATVALAPGPYVLAAGVLIAGSSTGLASPPLAAAVSRWIHAGVQERAQTIVNAGTGIGVLVSGPVALALLDQWRWAWALFSLLAAAVTVWVWVTVPPATAEPVARSAEATDPPQRGYVPGTAAMVLAALLMGASSVAVWTFGRELVTSVGGASSLVSTSMWTVLGAAGVVGALGGDLAAHVGLARSWTTGMAVMAAATVLLVLLPGNSAAVFAAAAVFGASYIILTALVLLWSTRLYPARAAAGVGLGFLAIALGQAIGAPLAGLLTDVTGAAAAFLTCAGLGLLGSLVRPGRSLAATSG